MTTYTYQNILHNDFQYIGDCWADGGGGGALFFNWIFTFHKMIF